MVHWHFRIPIWKCSVISKLILLDSSWIFGIKRDPLSNKQNGLSEEMILKRQKSTPRCDWPKEGSALVLNSQKERILLILINTAGNHWMKTMMSFYISFLCTKFRILNDGFRGILQMKHILI